MKILIVDDEKLTRDGLLSTINWKKLHIDDILIAENGVQGLRIAKEHRPEIILSDIRMPKLGGIEMAEQLQPILPNTSIIFMSGYSDKEYLKAAIKLKAISYVEKPLDPLEIEEAIQTAIEENQALVLTQTSVKVHNLAKTTQLALRLTYPNPSEDSSLNELFDSLALTNLKTNYLTTVIVKFEKPMYDEDSASSFHTSLIKATNFISTQNIYELHTFKHETHLIYHLFQSKKTTERTLSSIASYLQQTLQEYGNYFIIIGKTVHGYEHAFESYSTAVILSQKTFFMDYFSILTEETALEHHSNNLANLTDAFTEAFLQTDKNIIVHISNELLVELKSCTHLLPVQVKDIYYKLFMAIQTAYKKYQLNLNAIGSDENSILGYVEPCLTLTALHKTLNDKTDTFFKDLENYQPENPLIFAIKEFIGQNHSNDMLSVKDIGTHVNLTTSYVCTIFKSETGQTLNQYITDYRIQKAKDLLLDPRYKISDISSKVGYSDGNYFGKSFKKAVGLSPSEFRERMLL
ncbi:MAG: response regulator [Eubacteriales bacterium]